MQLERKRCNMPAWSADGWTTHALLGCPANAGGAPRAQVNEELKQYFRPEFLNRLDEIIVFRQLTKAEVKQIADIMLKEVFVRAEGKGIKIDVTERFKARAARPQPLRAAVPAKRCVAVSHACKVTLFPAVWGS